MARRPCQLVGGILLSFRFKICSAALLALILAVCVSSVALGDPPITPPIDPSVVPVVTIDDPIPPAAVVLPQPALQAIQQAALQRTKQQAAAYRKAAWHWQDLMGLRHTGFSRAAARTQSLPYAQWGLKVWKTRAMKLHLHAKRWMARRITNLRVMVGQWRGSMGVRAPKRQLAASGSLEARFIQSRRIARQVYQQYLNPPQKSNFECIHRFEGSWTDQDSGHNGHFGGVQMGKAEWDQFGRPYTHKQYPYQATKLDQLWAAYRYWLVSGFRPWPQTARDCGLL